MAIDCTSPVMALGDFIHCVSEMRKAWGLPKHKELWFRARARTLRRRSYVRSCTVRKGR